MANLLPRRRDLLNSTEDLFGNLMTNFWDDSKFNVDIKETDAEYEVIADLPGFKKEEIDVMYTDEILTISAKHEESSEDKDEKGRYLRRERSTSSFQRQFMIKNVDDENIKAKFENGVLTLTLPKSGKIEDLAKKITIE